MMMPGDIPEEMLDRSIEPSDDWRGWKPVNSIVDDHDLDEIEGKIGHKLPLTYREFSSSRCSLGHQLFDICNVEGLS